MGVLLREEGFTLSEILVTIFVLMLIIGVFSSLYLNSVNRILLTAQQSQSLHNTQQVMEDALAGNTHVFNDQAVLTPWDGSSGRPQPLSITFPGSSTITIPGGEVVVETTVEGLERSLYAYKSDF